MVRTILANKKHEKYLQQCGEQYEFSFGLIIGQPTAQNKDYIVHLARNSEHDVEIEQNEGTEASVKSVELETVKNIDDQALVNHVISATKMIPGCFYVLGVFIVSKNIIFDDDESIKRAKSLLQQINCVLNQNKRLCGSSEILSKNEKLLLSYSTASKNFICKLFEPKEGSGFFMPVDLKFLDKPTEWIMIESNYEFDDILPITAKENKINIEKHFQSAIETVTGYIENSEIFIQSEIVDDTQCLENYIKMKQNKKETGQSLKASIFLPAKPSTTDPITIEKFNGMIRFSGIISSRVWNHPKNSFKEVHTSIKNDILRSLTARIQIYCDGLTDPNANNDIIVISEPPRRVFFDIPEGGGIQFSEYIFRGETPTVAVAQAKEILDLEINSEAIHADLEGLPEDDSFTLSSQSSGLLPKNASQGDISRTMYMAGIVIALLVLLLSILLHFVFR